MQYKILYIDPLWKPDGGIKLWKTDKQTLPHGNPLVAKLTLVKNQDDMIKRLSSLLN